MAETATTYASMAKALREGETLSRSERLPIESVNAKKASKRLSAMRNSFNQLAGRTRDATQRAYRVESGQFFTYDGSALILSVALTCMEDEGEDDI